MRDVNVKRTSTLQVLLGELNKIVSIEDSTQFLDQGNPTTNISYYSCVLGAW